MLKFIPLNRLCYSEPSTILDFQIRNLNQYLIANNVEMPRDNNTQGYRHVVNDYLDWFLIDEEIGGKY